MFCFSSGLPVRIGVHESMAMIGDNQIQKNIGRATLSTDVIKLYGMCKLVPHTMICQNFIASLCIQFDKKIHGVIELQVKLIRFRNKNTNGNIESPSHEILNPEVLTSLFFSFDNTLVTFYDEGAEYRNPWKATNTTPVKVMLNKGDLIGVTVSFGNIELAAFNILATAS